MRRALASAVPERRLAVFTALIALAGPSGWAQPVLAPQRVRIICPAAAGGSIDILTRQLATRLALLRQQPFLVDNRPGAGTTLGTVLAAHAAPDGSTLLVTANPLFAVGPQLYATARYDPETSFTPIAAFARSAPFLVVANASPLHSVADLVGLARARPGQLTVAHFGHGGSSHLPAELLRRQAAIDVAFVPYKSEADSLADLLSDRVQAAFYYGPMALPLLRAGRLRALAYAGTERSHALAQTPTLAEAGYPSAEYHIDWLLLAPAGLRQDLVASLQTDVQSVLQDPGMREALTSAGATPGSGLAADAKSLIAQARIDKVRLLTELGLIRP